MGSSGAHTFLIHTPTLSLDETYPSSMAYMLLPPLWPRLTDPSSNQISGCLLRTSASTLSLGPWKSIRAGPRHGQSPNLPGWRPMDYRKGESNTLPMARMCTLRQLTPHFITIAVSRVLPQISLTVPRPSHGIPALSTGTPLTLGQRLALDKMPHHTGWSLGKQDR